MTAWMDRGACRGNEDPETWFPAGEGRDFAAQIAQAKAVCAGCPVRLACLDYALDHSMKGIWGGRTDDEREKDRRHRRYVRSKAVA